MKSYRESLALILVLLGIAAVVAMLFISYSWVVGIAFDNTEKLQKALALVGGSLAGTGVLIGKGD